MKKTHHTTEQIIRILREAETSGQSHEELCRQHNISSQTFYNSTANRRRRGRQRKIIIQLPSVATNDFLVPIEVDFGRLKAGRRNALFTLI